MSDQLSMLVTRARLAHAEASGEYREPAYGQLSMLADERRIARAAQRAARRRLRAIIEARDTLTASRCYADELEGE